MSLEQKTIVSDCGLFRYVLHRKVAGGAGYVSLDYGFSKVAFGNTQRSTFRKGGRMSDIIVSTRGELVCAFCTGTEREKSHKDKLMDALESFAEKLRLEISRADVAEAKLARAVEQRNDAIRSPKVLNGLGSEAHIVFNDSELAAITAESLKWK